MNIIIRLRRLSPSRIIILSFLCLILCGTGLLMLPWATANGEGASFSDALFTSVSASCVTGLTTVDTAAYWTLFGQLVILAMIQVGGFGVITVAVSLAALSGQRIGLMQRSLSKEAVSAPQLGGIVPLLYFILRLTFFIEFLGALFLAPSFCQKVGLVRGIYFAVFHSISSFCNAGFDLFGNSLMDFSADPVVNITVMLLILAGGLGFTTWADIRRNLWHFCAYTLQSKIILLMTSALIILPAIFFLVCENTPDAAGTAHIWASFFQSVTARTAGYNTIEIEGFSESGRAILVLLMLIGGSPGSTAGGCKTTTVFTLLATALAAFRLKKDVTCFSRRLPEETIRQAITVFMMYLLLFLGGSIFLHRLDDIPLIDCAFETASAIGTVGLSIGVTEKLSLPSQYVMMLLMFFGRIGGLTVLCAAHANAKADLWRQPEEKIAIG